MNFNDIKEIIKDSYRTPDNIVSDFYIPLLSRAKAYDRAVGFFSSSILVELSRGLINLVNNGGKMRLITSPKLQEKDIEAIKNGYDKRSIINEAIMREWKEPRNIIEAERLNFLSHLITDGYLDIKVAFKKPFGLYHEKIGILTDADGNSVAFSGSLNESEQAVSLNFESIDTFTSWKDNNRTQTKIQYFEETWNNCTDSLDVIDFPKIALDKLQTYKKDTYIKNIDEYENSITINKRSLNILKSDNVHVLENNEIQVQNDANVPRLPFDKLREYQETAILSWKNNNYTGIFDMATGTGKTYTGLGALVNLYNHCNGDLAVIISCPFIHLVEQWVEDLIKFNIEPIIGYGTSAQKNWKQRLERAIECHNRKVENKQFFCFITTNTTFSSNFVQEQINKLDCESLILVDEAHYFGSEGIREILPEHFKYRLALSATINRHGDEVGTKYIFNFFGNKCIEYTLDMAISAGMLTPYYYYPILVYLTPEELSEYKVLSKTIAKFMIGKDKKHIPEAAKPYLLKRARLVAGAENKLYALRENILKYKKGNHILVYCGATTIDDPNSTDKESIRQIQAVTRMLGNELNMKVAQFTSQEDMKERSNIKTLFARGDMLQALVAIKCLDEGFNIPEIQTAFILASTTNPKEYIQRRGRVLRLAPNKKFAEIYDFITLPRTVEDSHNLTEFEQQYEQGLVKREFDRMNEFNRLAINSTQNNQEIIWDLIASYNLYDKENVYDIV